MLYSCHYQREFTQQEARVAESTGYVKVIFRVHKEGPHWVSICPDFGVSSFGATLEEAFGALSDAIEVFLDTLEDEGEFESFLQEHNIKLIPGEPPPDGDEVEVKARPNEFVLLQTVLVHRKLAGIA